MVCQSLCKLEQQWHCIGMRYITESMIFCYSWQFDGTILLITLLVLFLLLALLFMWWFWPLCCTVVSLHIIDFFKLKLP